ncbi:Polyprenol reductase 1 [Colletotrichum sp. SAR11_239]|nr:Polyprenol reductase 1 [Colletotrichum sp. SAR11_239]
MDSLTTAASALSPAQWCQVFFGLSSAAVLAIQVIPKAAQHAILDYGARSPATTDDQTKGDGPQATNMFNDLVKAFASIGQIPHAWFMHFYVASIAGSAFWAFEYLRDGPFLRLIAARQAQSASPAMSLEQTILIWALMALQGSPALRASSERNLEALLSFQSVIGVAMYLYGWTMQNWCHKHLASLKKYSLPERGLFRYLICPHYTCECLLYLGLAIAAAPKGQWINRTLLSAFWFIVANLGTTADGTKEWYAQKFGAEKVASKWKMIPFLF